MSRRKNSTRGAESLDLDIRAEVVAGRCADCSGVHYGVHFLVTYGDRLVMEDILGPFATYEEAAFEAPVMLSEYASSVADDIKVSAVVV